MIQPEEMGFRSDSPMSESYEQSKDIFARVFSSTLLVAVVAGGVLYAIGLWNAIQIHSLPLGIAYSGMYVILLVLAFVKSLPYRLRAGLMLLVIFAAGVLAILFPSYGGDGRVWMLGFVALAAVFWGLRTGVFSTVLSTITYLLLDFLVMNGLLAGQTTLTRDFNSWLAATLSFLTLALVVTVACSLAIQALESNLAKSNQAITNLELERDELKLGSLELEKRLVQLHTVAEISHDSNTVLEPGKLLEKAISLIQERFNLYYVGVFILDENKGNAILKAGTGEAGEKMLATGHSLSVGGASMIGWAIANRKARIALDTGSEAIRFDNPYLPLTRSELALPLVVGKRCIGALTIQSEMPNAFDENDLAVLQGLADSLATTLENARLFQEVQKNLKEIEALNRQYLNAAWTEQITDFVRLQHVYQAEDASASVPGETYRVPLVIRDQIIGDLTIESSNAVLTAEEIQLIEATAAQTAQALENARLIQETQYKAYQEELIGEFSSRIRESLNLDSLLRTAVRELGDRLNLSEVEAYVGWDDWNQPE
jgi:GAF domain-containing protein